MTAPRYLLDTNICIYIAKHNPPEVRQHFIKHRKEHLAMSVVILGELWHGAEKSQAREKAVSVLNQMTSAIQILELPVDAAVRYGEIRAVHIETFDNFMKADDVEIERFDGGEEKFFPEIFR